MVKKDQGAKSYSEAIRALLRRAKRPTKSEMGSLPKLKEFKRERSDRFD